MCFYLVRVALPGGLVANAERKGKSHIAQGASMKKLSEKNSSCQHISIHILSE